MGVLRQAAQQSVESLVARDMITVAPVPGSKRNKAVSIAEKGQRWRKAAASQIRQIGEQTADAIGEDGKEILRQCLTDLINARRR